MHSIRGQLFVGLAAVVLLLGCGTPTIGTPTASRIYRIGYLAGGAAGPSPLRDAFLDGLRERGYVEGQNLVFEYRVAEGRPERLPGLARELVELNLDAIFASGEPAAEALLATGRETPLILAA
jgi:putative ABC transport system substrate-binding protein